MTGTRTDGESVDGGRRSSNPELPLPEWLYSRRGRDPYAGPLGPRRGDVILIGRRITLGSWLRSPLGTFISWRIQRCTGSRWNHVAGCIGRGRIVEAEWNCGVRISNLDEAYPRSRFDVAIAAPPREVNRLAAAETWEVIARDRNAYCYDWRAILLMRLAAAMYGPEGIRRRIRMDEKDGAVHCVELCALGWESGGFAGAVAALVEPSQFEQFVEPRRDR